MPNPALSSPLGALSRSYAAPMVAVLCLSGCLSMGSTRLADPFAEACATDQRLSGIWKGRASSQFGTQRIRIEFRCDCTYKYRSQTTIIRFTVKGFYRVESEQISLQALDDHEKPTWMREEWPFRSDETTVFLSFGDPEQGETELRRSKGFQCTSAGSNVGSE